MKVTFILKGLTDVFYEGRAGAIVGLNNMSDAERFAYLNKQANGGDLRDNIKQKIGRQGSFAEKVELNSLLKRGHSMAYTLEPRKGYKLATFLIEGA